MKVDNFVLLIISIVTLIVISLLTECNRGRLIELENKATKEIVETFFHTNSPLSTEPGQKGYKIKVITEGQYGGISRQQVLNSIGGHIEGDYISESEKQQYGSGLFDSTISGIEKNPVDCNLTITSVNSPGLTPYHRVQPIKNYSYGGDNCQTIYGPGYTYDPPSGQINPYSIHDIPTIFGSGAIFGSGGWSGGCDAKSLFSDGDIKLFEVGGDNSLLEKININLKTTIRLTQLKYYLESYWSTGGHLFQRYQERTLYPNTDFESGRNLINISTDTEYEIFYNIRLDRLSACDGRTGKNKLTIKFIKRKKPLVEEFISFGGVSVGGGGVSVDFGGVNIGVGGGTVSISATSSAHSMITDGNTNTASFGGGCPSRHIGEGNLLGTPYSVYYNHINNASQFQVSNSQGAQLFQSLYYENMVQPTLEQSKETVKQALNFHQEGYEDEEILYVLTSNVATINPGGNNNEILFSFNPIGIGNPIISNSDIINNGAPPQDGNGDFDVRIIKNPSGSIHTHKIEIENNTYKQKTNRNADDVPIQYVNTGIGSTLGQLREIINAQLNSSHNINPGLVVKTYNYGPLQLKSKYCSSTLDYIHSDDISPDMNTASNANITYDYSELSLYKLLNRIHNKGFDLA